MAAENNANIEAVLADFKKKAADLQKARVSGGATLGAAIGSVVPVVGTAIGSLIGSGLGYVSTIFGKKQVWSGLSGTDKGNLIDGLAVEAVWEKNLTSLEVAKNYVIGRLKTTKVLGGISNAEFWQKNAWASNHVKIQVDKYNDAIKMAQDIVEKTKISAEKYEASKRNLMAKSAIFKIKKGEGVTDEERTALKSHLEGLTAVGKIKQLKG